ncbi:MAG: tripartite tricarboxylate transporter substrate binding protein [Reyranella sp.]|uniref:Bug family tripartite tricarboxylate transporter substrate binding protein n=1 Tax=Reyranella sp. TaxID=1929291 RepID=UPI0027312F69|nr:tripartite tricarboxylate transporter substrate binding protein [Reyranella sp.]MDP1962015.1 tripartite tricarboxylate transporter substrate binding protein [Reyranella sp.]MDP2378704.1 tripartite tricarboxylate transporter substrate binding protein [Reyranella sp.]
MKHIERRTLIGAGLATAVAGRTAFAQTFPTKQIRWIIPFAPGGNYDVTSRLVSEPMARQLGQGILIDNKPGAGGVVGLELAHNAPADGYTIVMASFTVGYVAPIFAGKKEMLSLFAPVGILTTVPMVVVTRADSRFADMKSLLAEAKAKPGTVSIGHAGNGTTNHVAILRLQLNENIKFNVIPYRGSGPGIADLLAGNIDCYTDQLTSSMPHIKSGKLRPLGTLGLDRIPDLPNVPTLADLGLKPFDGSTTAGVFTHADTPKAVIARLNEGVVAGLKDETASKRLRELGAIVRPSTPEQFTVALKADQENVSELLRLGLLKPE